ncbi:MAG: transketolase [Candidatus Methanoperedens sp.]|jgi:transketolase|nr:transketolase [Candidatus Methanoperedens sp.]PKL53871.1 MAG: transketolase [Candidatus Methanoperedenaceae archaeon HGW-Methanoperedenaceae-1]
MLVEDSKKFSEFLRKKALCVRKETLNIHRMASETRIASSLSCVEIFVTMYYGKILNFDSSNISWVGRDRFIISKGHGAISLYPILADLGYFDKSELSRVCKEGSFLGGIPDSIVPGFETINGSLGHGLGVACGISLALRNKNRDEKVFVLLGDGELYEGSVWEAIMFAGEHKLDNLVVVLDYNKVCMLDYCKNILDMEPLEEKFKAFKWDVKIVDGHDVEQLYKFLLTMKEEKNNKPKLLIANTVKGKGVPRLETDSLSHVISLASNEIDEIIAGLQ